MSKETTTVEKVEIQDLDQLLNPGADVIMLPESDKPKLNLFSRNPENPVSFKVETKELEVVVPKLEDKPELDENGQPKVVEKPKVEPIEIDNLLNEEEEAKKNTGRPKVDKEGLVELANKLIEKKLLVPFDDGKDIKDYTLQDFEELFEANAAEKERVLRDQLPGEFYSSLPPEFQYAAKYLADGGQDLKGLLRTLAAVEEVKSLDPGKDGDQRSIVRSYLQATNFGTSDEIEEEINAWDDRGELEAKANKFKPKLDALSQQQVQYQLQQQEHLRAQQTKQAELYLESVYKTLEPGELNGIKLDKKTQNLLFTGLVHPNYQSASGKPTNLLGHLLEKYQYIEPDHGKLARALWLLADEEGYNAKIREVSKKEVVADTQRKLKTESQSKIASHVENEEVETKKPGLPRPSQNFFKR